VKIAVYAYKHSLARETMARKSLDVLKMSSDMEGNRTASNN
jgi:hypothetical protein